MASPEELAQLIENTVRAVLAGLNGGTSHSQANGGWGRRVLEAKGVSRVDTFQGKETQWKEWAFQFRVAIKAMESRAAEIMAKVETQEDARVLED